VVGVVIVLAVLSVAVRPGKKSPSSKGSSTTTTTATASGASGAIPVLGVTVQVNGHTVENPAGTQIVITDASGNHVPLQGVTVTAVRDSVKADGKTSPTPAGDIPLVKGDVIWGIGELSSSSYTQVTSGPVLTVFLKNYAVAGHTDNVYVYYYDPKVNQNFANDPPQVALLESTGSIGSINCTTGQGC
jgi:hypothetical protein